MLRRKEIPRGLSLKRACELLKVRRSRVCYKSKRETKENKKLIEKIEELYTKDPTLGYRRMKAMLEREMGVKINLKKVRRLMRLIRVKRITPAPKTTKTTDTTYKNPLRHFNVKKPNQVWCADITYIRVKGGFAYGMAIVDLYSRKVFPLR